MDAVADTPPKAPSALGNRQNLTPAHEGETHCCQLNSPRRLRVVLRENCFDAPCFLLP